MSVRIIGKPNPFNESTFEAEAEEGHSIYELVGKDSINITVSLNGENVDQKKWKKLIPKKGDTLILITSPLGNDDGKNPLATILMIVVTIVATVYGGPLGAQLAPGLSATASAGIGTSLITLAGALAINALLPPVVQEPDRITSSRYSGFNNVGNYPNKYGMIPKICGEVEYLPPLAANTYTEHLNNEQYLRMLLCIGYGPLDIGGKIVGKSFSGEQIESIKGSIYLNGKITQNTQLPTGTIKIGETSIEEFTDYEFEIGTPDEITLYTNDIAETYIGASFSSSNAGPEEAWRQDNLKIVRTTETETENISIDLIFPGGLWSIGKDGQLNEAREYYVYAVDPSEDSSFESNDGVTFNPNDDTYTNINGSVIEPNEPIQTTQTLVTLPTDSVEINVKIIDKVTGYTAFSETVMVNGGVTDPFVQTFNYNVDRGQYDVEVTRIKTYVRDTENLYNEFIWGALRSIRYQKPWHLDNAILMAIKIKKTDQFSGSLDQITVKTTSVVEVWDGSSIKLQISKNPAWIYMDALRGVQIQHKVPTNKIALSALKSWADWCDLNNFTYNWVHQSEETVLDRIRAIASTGRASWSLVDGLFTVVRDTLQTLPIQMFTPSNSWDFKSTKIFPDKPHALKVRYLDTASKQQAERIVYADNYDETNATKFEILDTQGVDNPDQAWKIGRYYIATVELRPEIFSLRVDYESIVSTRGDYVTLMHDTMLVGLGSGRVTDILKNSAGRVISVTLDMEIELELGTSYQIRFRTQSNLQINTKISNVSGFTDTFGLTDSQVGIEIGDLAVLGVLGSEIIDAKILSINPSSDLTAELKLVDLANGILTADGGTIPPYDPQITIPIERRKPPTPEIVSLVPAFAASTAQPSGNPVPSIILHWRAAATELELESAEARYTNNLQTWKRVTGPVDGKILTLQEIVQNTEYTVQVKLISSFGISSDWSLLKTVKALPVFTIIPDVKLLRLRRPFDGTTIEVVWQPSASATAYKLKIRIGGKIVREVKIVDTSYVYTVDAFYLDGENGRDITVLVKGTKDNSESENWATLNVSNPQMSEPRGIQLSASYQTIYFKTSISPEIDFEATRVVISLTPGADPDSLIPVYEDNSYQGEFNTFPNGDNFEQDTLYYIYIAHYDNFNDKSLNWSSELAIRTLKINIAIAEVLGASPWAFEIDPVDQAFIDEHMFDDAIASEKIVSLVAGKIATGIMLAQITVSGLITTSVTGWALDLGPVDDNGRINILRYHNNAGIEAFWLDDSGNGFIGGDITIDGSVTIGGTKASDLEQKIPLFADFFNETYLTDGKWVYTSESTTSFNKTANTTSGITGDGALVHDNSIADGTQSGYSTDFIKFDENALYELSARLQRSSATEDGVAYVGIRTFDINKNPIGTNTGHIWLTCNAVRPASYTEYKGYFQGEGTHFPSASDKDNPTPITAGTEYFKLAYFANYSNLKSIFEFDYIVLNKLIMNGGVESIPSGLTLTSGYIRGGNDSFGLEVAHKKIWINDPVFKNQGIQLEYNNGLPRFYVGNGDEKSITVDTENSVFEVGDEMEMKGLNAYGNDTIYWAWRGDGIEQFYVLENGASITQSQQDIIGAVTMIASNIGHSGILSKQVWDISGANDRRLMDRKRKLKMICQIGIREVFKFGYNLGGVFIGFESNGANLQARVTGTGINQISTSLGTILSHAVLKEYEILHDPANNKTKFYINSVLVFDVTGTVASTDSVNNIFYARIENINAPSANVELKFLDIKSYIGVKS